LSVFINERSEILRLVNQSLLSDLGNHRIPFQTLSLSFIANCGNSETAETLSNNITKMMMNPSSTTYLLKKASLCLLHLYRKNPEVVQPASYVDKIKDLLKHTDGGVLTAVLSLLLGLTTKNPDLFEEVVPAVCSLLNKVVNTKYVQGDYMYDHIPAPWLIVKGLQFLQHYNTLANEQAYKDLEAVLRKIVNTDSKNFAAINQSNRHLKRHNAMLAVLVEAINVVVKLHMEAPMVQRAIQHIRYFMGIGDPDMRYLALEAAQVLCPLDSSTTGDDAAFVSVVEKTLRHPDISLRRRALDVLFEMCSGKNSSVIVNKLVEYLDIAEYELKEELVLKIAILAEKYPVNNQWYLDIIFRLIQTAGDATPQEIWFRTVQIISIQPQIHEYAATISLKIIRKSTLPENAVRIASYLLGEYHHKIPNTEENEGGLEEAVFKMQHHYSRSTSNVTQAIVVSGLSKIGASPRVPQEIKDTVQEFLKGQITNVAEDTQERAVEALALINGGATQAAASFAPMPPFTVRQSILLKDLKKKVKQRGGVEKGSTHLEGIKDEEEENEQQEEETDEQAKRLAQEAAQLAESGGVKATPAPAQATAAASTATPSDPASAISGLVSASVGAPSTGYISTQRPVMTPTKERFQALLVSNEGVLFDNANLTYHVTFDSIKVTQNVVTFNIKMTYTSKMASLDNIQGVINNVPGITFVQTPANPPKITGKGATSTQVFELKGNLEGTFVEPPTFQFSCTAPPPYNAITIQPLKLPVVMSKFFCPITPPKQEFQKAWDAITGPTLEKSHVFLPKGTAVTPPILGEIVKTLTGPFRFQILNQYDTTPNTLCFAACVRPNPTAKMIAIMLKISPAGQGQISIKVKSTDANVTASVRQFVIEQFL
jgi:AP-2 complex subunit alpha